MPRESLAERKKRAAKIFARLRKRFPNARTELVHSNPLELLVAVILSAQCTDVRVNLVTKSLFRKYRTSEDYAAAEAETFEKEIRSTGFYRNKTKSVLGMAKMLVEKFHSCVPDTMEELLELPGVARKTANVVLGTAFGKNEGVVVDTHISRVSQRLRLTSETSPEKIELDLMELLPRKDWTPFGNTMVLHGRYVCVARKPRCGECCVNDLCPSAFKC
jgi:endonuclease-3